MRIEDSRRLTGFNLMSPRAGAICEVRFQAEEEVEACLRAWSEALDQAFSLLSWGEIPRWVRRYEDMASLLFDAPLDALYAATEINEWAVSRAKGEAPRAEAMLSAWQEALSKEANPRLLALESEAARRGLPFVWDDDFVSLGTGKTSKVWPTSALPESEDVAWDALAAIPLAYITGTNGKTTSTRMTARIMEASGKTPGSTSSDGVVVAREHIERGDWTGTGAARRVLRHPEVEVALLETARGGMLRRGLVSPVSNAALITNVASDHLGEYGISTVADMAEVKWLVAQSVRPSGQCVLNADDPFLAPLGQQSGARISWFTLEQPLPWLKAHVEAGGEAWVLEEGWLCMCRGKERFEVIALHELPSAYGGAARHNIANALGAAALSHSLGAPLEAVREGLLTFGASADDNPGRCQFQEVGGAQLILDFGHNPHGVKAMLSMARRLMAERSGARLWVSVGQAGDRSDEDLTDLAQVILDAAPDMVSLREILGYERGRASGEAASIMRDALVRSGRSFDAIRMHEDEVSAMRDALSWASPGDLIVHLVHIQRDALGEFLAHWQ